MQKYCTSLEVSKRLKESGWSKSTNFCHIEHKDINLPGYKNCVVHGRMEELDMYPEPYWNLYPSPHSAEILEELPVFVGLYKAEMHGYSVRYIDNYFRSTKLCDALAECWIWAKEKGLIKEVKCQAKKRGIGNR